MRPSNSYSVYDLRGRRLVGGVDREAAVRVKDQAVRSGVRDVSLIRRGQEKQPGPRQLDG